MAYWPRAVELHDCLLEFLPQQFAVALAVYRNGLDTFTPFLTNRGRLRARATRIKCDGMFECVPEVLAHASNLPDVTAIINVTDLTAACEPRKGLQVYREGCGAAARPFPFWSIRCPTARRQAMKRGKHSSGSRGRRAANSCPSRLRRCRGYSTISTP